jgi:hypothetical protein
LTLLACKLIPLKLVPYTTEQIIANAVRILMASKMFPTRDFEAWDVITPKTYPALKTFFHEAYNRRLNAIDLQNTSGALEYAPAQNMYNVLEYGNDDDSTTDGSMITAVQPPGLSTEAASSLGGGQSMANSAVQLMAAINQSIAPVFNQVVQNQATLQQQIAALSVGQNHPVAQAHPVHQVAFPMQQPFQQMARMRSQRTKATTAHYAKVRRRCRIATSPRRTCTWSRAPSSNPAVLALSRRRPGRA